MVIAVNRSLAAAGAGNRVGGMPSWCCEELGSSVNENVLRVLFFHVSSPFSAFLGIKPVRHEMIRGLDFF